MKSIVKKSRLLLLSLVGFLVIGVVSIAIGITIINTAPDDSEHKVRLHSLYLDGSVTDKDLIGVESGKKNLDINNGLVVGFGHTVESSVKYSSIGGGRNSTNSANIRGGGIGGGLSNKINGNNSAIGGGDTNMTNGYNAVIVGGSSGNSYMGGVVLGGNGSNAYDYGVVLGGGLNFAEKYSLVLGKSAYGKENSFAWNGNAELNTARIEANSGVLIGTYSPIHGVSLVVSGSVKLGSGHDGNKGAIRLNSSGCLTMYDGHTHVLGKKSKSMCGVASGCQFGGVLLQDGDVVTGYAVSYSTNCNSNDNIISVQCNNGNLSRPAYPYCYKIDSDPRGVGGGGGGGGSYACKGNIPAHATANGTTTRDSSRTDYVYGTDSGCTFQCKSGYTWNGEECTRGGGGGGGDCSLCDINGDGEITVADVNLINNCIQGILNGNAPSYCDFNGDGEIILADVTYLPGCATCAQNG